MYTGGVKSIFKLGVVLEGGSIELLVKTCKPSTIYWTHNHCVLLYRVNYCTNWTIVNNKLLCKQTVLHTSESNKNNSIDNQRDSCYSSWLIVQKTILIKKNHLICDHTTGEVLTTSNNDYNNITANT